MRFVEDHTGEVYSADDALDHAFDCADCDSGACPIGQRASARNMSCCDYVELYPHEAAPLMGCNILV